MRWSGHVSATGTSSSSTGVRRARQCHAAVAGADRRTMQHALRRMADDPELRATPQILSPDRDEQRRHSTEAGFRRWLELKAEEPNPIGQRCIIGGEFGVDHESERELAAASERSHEREPRSRCLCSAVGARSALLAAWRRTSAGWGVCQPEFPGVPFVVSGFQARLGVMPAAVTR